MTVELMSEAWSWGGEGHGGRLEVDPYQGGGEGGGEENDELVELYSHLISILSHMAEVLLHHH